MANNLTNPTDDQEKNDEAVDGTNAAVDESASSDVASDIDEDEQERMLILAQADQVKGMQLVLSENGEFSSEPELRAYALSEGPRDPERMYELYYKGIERLLRRFLPSGKGAAARKACEIVREEKSVYLTRGHQDDALLGRRKAVVCQPVAHRRRAPPHTADRRHRAARSRGSAPFLPGNVDAGLRGLAALPHVSAPG
jgi:hypothetical protein